MSAAQVATSPPRSPTFVVPGEIRVQRAPGGFTTVLGSCVSVFLWAAREGVGGLNHYLLPRSAEGERSGRIGASAIELLLEEVLRAGAARAGVCAKVFGGAVSGRYSWNVGAENVLVAWEALRRARVPIVASDVGGVRGRQLALDVGTGVVRVRYVGGLDSLPGGSP